MGRETKVGLLVGLVFIVLFGVILSGRAGTMAPEHAVLPTGESQSHRTSVETLGRTVDPFGKGESLEVQGPDAGLARKPEPVEEPLPAPERLTPVDAPPAKADDRGTVAFGPAVIETPTGREADGLRVAKGDDPFERLANQPPIIQPTETDRRIYTVKAGDTLTSVARQFYGKDGNRLWKRILEANKATLHDSNRLAVGQKLVIPGLPVETPKTEPAKPDTPRMDPLREAAGDTYLVEGRTMPKADPPSPKDKRAARDTLKGMTVPDAGRPAKADRDAVRDVTVDDLARMYGMQSDLVEQPARPPALYTVQAGDTFYRIADRVYGDGAKYGRLLQLKNQHLVSDPGKLRIGQRIILLDGVSGRSDAAVALR